MQMVSSISRYNDEPDVSLLSIHLARVGALIRLGILQVSGLCLVFLASRLIARYGPLYIRQDGCE